MRTEDEMLFGIDKLNVPRSDIPAVTHVDYSARIQTVHEETNPRYHGLIKAFKEQTGCPIVVNTSFNVRGEPIVCTPEDAFRCFMGTEMDTLVLATASCERISRSPHSQKTTRTSSSSTSASFHSNGMTQPFRHGMTALSATRSRVKPCLNFLI